MPNQRSPEKRLVAWWLTPAEKRQLTVVMRELGYADRAVWLREKITEDYARARRTPAPKRK